MGRTLRVLLVLCFFVCPLLFFTDLTRNPYYTQIALLNAAIMAGSLLIFGKSVLSGRPLIPRTPLDLPLGFFLGSCVVTWAIAYAGHAAYFRPAMWAEGVRVMAFTVVNVLLAYYLSAACARDLPAEPDVNPAAWAAFAVVWGSAWLMFAKLRSGGGHPLDIWAHLWDPYGGLLWVAGFAVVVILARGATVHHFWHVALTAGFLASIYGIMQYFNTEIIWPKVLNPYGGRAVSTFGNPNFMSSYLVMLLPVALAYYLHARELLARAVYGAFFLAIAACLLGSLTRSSWAGGLAAVGVLFLSPEVRRSIFQEKARHAWLAGALLAVVLLWPQSSVTDYTPSVWGRVKELTTALDMTREIPYSPLYQRVLIWACAWMMGAESPLFGKGWGLFELYYPFYQGHLLNSIDFFRYMRTHANNAHNEVLELWAQMGILGVGGLLWLWFTFIVSALRWLRELGACASRAAQLESLWLWAALAGVIGMLVDNVLNVSMHFAVPAFLFWWQAGIVMGRLGHREGKLWELAPAGVIGRQLAFAAACVVFVAGSVWWARQWKREVHYFLGYKLLRANQIPAAVDQLETAHRWHSREVNTNYELGNAYARSENFDRALWAYDEALRSNAGYDEIYFNRATILAQRLGRFDEALKYYETAVWINPLSPDIYNNLSAFYLREPAKYRERCIELLERASHFFPDNPHYLNNLGYLYHLGKETAKAEAAWIGALRIQPDFEQAERNFLGFLQATGRTEHAFLRELSAFKELKARAARGDRSPDTARLAQFVGQAFPKAAAVKALISPASALR